MRGGLGGPSWRLAVERESRLLARCFVAAVVAQRLVDVVERDDFLSKCLGAAFPGDKRPMDQRPLVSGKQLAQTVQVSA